MTPVKVVPIGAGSSLDAFRRAVLERCRGDAKPRPGDCTGARFVVRDDYAGAFRKLAASYELGVQSDSREAFPGRSSR